MDINHTPILDYVPLSYSFPPKNYDCSTQDNPRAALATDKSAIKEQSGAAARAARVYDAHVALKSSPDRKTVKVQFSRVPFRFIAWRNHTFVRQRPAGIIKRRGVSKSDTREHRIETGYRRVVQGYGYVACEISGRPYSLGRYHRAAISARSWFSGCPLQAAYTLRSGLSVATAERYLYTCRLNMLFDRGNDRLGHLSWEVYVVVGSFDVVMLLLQQEIENCRWWCRYWASSFRSISGNFSNRRIYVLCPVLT